MTYAYHCGKCGPRFSDEGVIVERSWGMKQSCCHKCDNPTCKDYGKCDCMDIWLEKNLENMRNLVNEDPERFVRNLIQQTEEE